MADDYQKCLPVILRFEGGFSNHPRDPGGVTLEGIIQRVYDAWRTRQGRPRRALTPDMRNTPEWIEERNAIYRAQYWNAIRGDELPAGVDLVVFDGAVNSGPFQSVKWLQRALGVEADGHLGEGTLDALSRHPDHDALIADICARRLGMLRQLTTWPDFGGGWTARVAIVKRIGQAWATGKAAEKAPIPVDAHLDRGDAKGYASDVDQPAIDARTATGTGIGGGSVSIAVDTAKDALAPVVGTSKWLDTIYTVLIVAGVVITIGGFAYAWWASRKSRIAQAAIDGDLRADVPEGQPA